MRFKRKEDAETWTRINLILGKWIFFPTNMGRSFVLVMISHEIFREVIIAAVINKVENVELMQVSLTKQVVHWGYGIEMFMMIAEEQMSEFPEVLNLPDSRSINAIAERHAQVLRTGSHATVCYAQEAMRLCVTNRRGT